MRKSTNSNSMFILDIGAAQDHLLVRVRPVRTRESVLLSDDEVDRRFAGLLRQERKAIRPLCGDPSWVDSIRLTPCSPLRTSEGMWCFHADSMSQYQSYRYSSSMAPICGLQGMCRSKEKGKSFVVTSYLLGWWLYSGCMNAEWETWCSSRHPPLGQILLLLVLLSELCCTWVYFHVAWSFNEIHCGSYTCAALLFLPYLWIYDSYHISFASL